MILDFLYYFVLLVGAVLVALVLFVIIIALLIRWKMKSMMKKLGTSLEGLRNMAAMGGLPPLELELEEEDSPEWDDEVAIHQATSELNELGFRVVGTYAIEDNGVLLRLFHDPERHLDAALYEMPGQGIWVDVVATYRDGTYLTYSSTKSPPLDDPPGKEKRLFPELSPTELVQRMLAEMPDKPLEPVTAETLPERFVKYYNEEMEWRIARGGLTEEEIIRCAGEGETPDDEAIEHVRRMWRYHIAGYFDEKLRERFVDECKMPIKEYEKIRDRLLFVHEYSSPEDLADMTVEYFAYLEDMDRDDEDEEDDEPIDRDDDDDDEDYGKYELMQTEWVEDLTDLARTSGMRAAFAKFLTNHGLSDKYKKIDELKTPYPADVYVLPPDHD